MVGDHRCTVPRRPVPARGRHPRRWAARSPPRRPHEPGGVVDSPHGSERGHGLRCAVHRCRHGRHPQRHQADRGRAHRFHRLREGRRRRGHLAGEHLSRPLLRRALAPLLVLVRPHPGVEPPLLPRLRDPRLLRAGGRGQRGRCPAIRFGDPVTRCAVLRRTVDGDDGLRAPRRGRRGHRRHRRAPPSPLPGHRRAGHLRRGRCSTAPVGTTAWSWTGPGWASSAPGPRRCRSCRRWSTGSAHLSLFQRTAQWVMPQENPAYSEEERHGWRERPR